MSDRRTAKTGKGPCDRCGSYDNCRCGPCQCKWCRYERGEATEFEAAAIKRHLQDRDRPILKRTITHG